MSDPHAHPAHSDATPAWIYLAAAYAITWIAVWLIVSPHGMPGRPEVLASVYPIAFLAMAAGPPLAGLLTATIFDGRAGLQSLLRRLFDWRLPPVEYALALLVVPLTLVAVLVAASAISPVFRPGLVAGGDAPTLIAMGVLLGLLAGWCEEIGWTGFATPRLLARHGLLRTGILLGVVHGLWHLLIDYWGEGARFGDLFATYFIFLWVIGLVALRLLIVWLYARTRSILVAQLAHASYTGSLMILWPVTTDPAEIIAWTSAFAVALLLVVAGIIGFVRLPAPAGSPDF